MKRRYLLEQWNDYAQHMLPAGASTSHREAMRRTFMAGAVAVWGVMMGNLEQTRRTPSQELGVLDAIDEELHDFGESVKAQARGVV